MATFKAVVKSKSLNDTYKVYIRVIQLKKIGHIDTGMRIVASKFKDGKIVDSYVEARCGAMILGYIDKLNKENTKNWSLEEVLQYLKEDATKIPFYPFCDKFIDNMINEGRERTANNYKLALNSFRSYCGNDLTFQDIKSNMINNWIVSLKKTARAKEMYPTLIKAMFNAGKKAYNDYDNDRIKISHSPFENVNIPKADIAQQQAVSTEIIRKLFTVVPNTPRSELAQDIAKLTLYLVGINTVDLFETKKDSFVRGKLCYNRSKTKEGRRDKAYIEITVRPEIMPLFEKYKGNGDRLFNFGYKDNINFNRNVNKGLAHLCELAGIEKLTSYAFRHTWATEAKRICKSDELVGFCLNHASAHKTSRLYIKVDFSPIDDLNNQVLDAIFKPKKQEKRGRKKIENVVKNK